LPVNIAADAARRFLVARHMLAPARSVAGGPDGVLEVFGRLGSIQFDPLSVAGRSHDLVLHARVAGYDSAWCDLLYERRELLEAYAVTGVLGLARRDGNRRYYDLIERLLPPDILARKVPLRKQLRHKLLSRYRAHGLLGIGGGDIFGGLGRAKPDPERPEHPG